MDQNDKPQTLMIPGTDNEVLIDMIKSVYIAEGLSVQDIAVRYNQNPKVIEAIVEGGKLEELRAAYIRQGIQAIQSVQLTQAKKLMDIETGFKNMRIIQLQKMLEDFSGYYAKYGHFYKVHPLTGEILNDVHGIPMQMVLPNVGKEITMLKESVSLSEGLKNILGQIDNIINKKSTKEVTPLDENNTIDVTDYNKLFKKKSSRSDDEE